MRPHNVAKKCGLNFSWSCLVMVKLYDEIVAPLLTPSLCSAFHLRSAYTELAIASFYKTEAELVASPLPPVRADQLIL